MGDGEGAFLAPSHMSLYRVMSLKGQTFYKVMSHIGQVVGAGDEAFLATHHAGKEAFLASSPHMSLYRAMSLKGQIYFTTVSQIREPTAYQWMAASCAPINGWVQHMPAGLSN